MSSEQSSNAVALYVADSESVLQTARARAAPHATAADQWELHTLNETVDRLMRLLDRVAMRTKTPYVQAALKPRGF